MAAEELPRIDGLFGELPYEPYGEQAGVSSTPTQSFNWPAPPIRDNQASAAFLPAAVNLASIQLPQLDQALMASSKISGLHEQAASFSSAQEAENFVNAARRSPQLRGVDDVEIVRNHKTHIINELVKAISGKPRYPEDPKVRSRDEEYSLKLIGEFEAYLKLLGDTGCQQKTITAISTLIVDQIIRLHTEGDCLVKLPSGSVKQDNSLTATKRAQACIEAAFRCKGVCIDLIKGRKDGVVNFVATPILFEKRKYQYKRSNKGRGEQYGKDKQDAEKYRGLPATTPAPAANDQHEAESSPPTFLASMQPTMHPHSPENNPGSMYQFGSEQSTQSQTKGSTPEASSRTTKSRKRSRKSAGINVDDARPTFKKASTTTTFSSDFSPATFSVDTGVRPQQFNFMPNGAYTHNPFMSLGEPQHVMLAATQPSVGVMPASAEPSGQASALSEQPALAWPQHEVHNGFQNATYGVHGSSTSAELGWLGISGTHDAVQGADQGADQGAGDLLQHESLMFNNEPSQYDMLTGMGSQFGLTDEGQWPELFDSVNGA